MKYFYLALSSIIFVYLVVLIFIYFYQRNLLYHPAENNYQNDEAKFNYQEIHIEVDSSIKLKSWFLNKDLNSFKTLVIFHGNAGDLSNRIYKLNELNKLDINILLISWRGFSGNAGSPTEKNLYKDADAAMGWITPEALKDISDKDIPGFGELFRELSYKTVGTSAMQSRACAVLVNGKYIFALPGSSGGVTDAWDGILKYQLDINHKPCNFVELFPRLKEK